MSRLMHRVASVVWGVYHFTTFYMIRFLSGYGTLHRDECSNLSIFHTKTSSAPQIYPARKPTRPATARSTVTSAAI